MTLWFLLVLMTGAAVFAVLWPLGRKLAAPPGGHDARVYRDQLEEIARDQSAGRIGDAEAEAARIEVSRRLLASAESGTPPVQSPLWRRRAVALAALVIIPLLSAGLYLVLGSPSLPGQPLSARLDVKGTPPIEQLVAQVEAHLESRPQDGRGWEVIAPVYAQLGRFADAARAWRNAIIYNGTSAVREASLGEALALAANGVVTAEAKGAFERAIALEPKEPKARYFIGRAAQQDGRTAEAIAIWRDVIASAPPNAAYLDFVREELARAENPAQPGPGTEDAAAAGEMDPQQRQAMIAGMVERLAERLKRESADFEGWLRLVRAYTVLGERDKARSAVSDARRAVGSDAEKIRRLDELVKGLGLES